MKSKPAHPGGQKMRYAVSALFSTDVMIPTRFQHGSRRRFDVVNTTPQKRSPHGISAASLEARSFATSRVLAASAPVRAASRMSEAKVRSVDGKPDKVDRAVGSEGDGRALGPAMKKLVGYPNASLARHSFRGYSLMCQGGR